MPRRAWWGIAIGLFMSGLPAAGLWAHPHTVLLCGPQFQSTSARAVLTRAFITRTGLYAEEYDTDEDGVVDVQVLSVLDPQSPSGHSAFPLFYVIDQDHDHVPDVIYIDRAGLGLCADIVRYHELTTPPPLLRGDGL